MHSCPIPRPRSKIWKILEIPRPRFAQKSCGKSWKYQDQDQDLHRSLVKNLGIGSWILVFPRFSTGLLCKSWSWSWYFQDFPNLGSWSWYFQDFSQDFCANLGLGLGISKIFQILDLGLGISKIFHKTSVQILVLVLGRNAFSGILSFWLHSFQSNKQVMQPTCTNIYIYIQI